MIKKLKSEINVCSICNTEMPAEITHCPNCKADMIKGYIDTSARQRRRWSIIFLLIVCSLSFYNLYPTSPKPTLLIIIFAVALALSIALPYIYFRAKNKNKVIWKRKRL